MEYAENVDELEERLPKICPFCKKEFGVRIVGAYKSGIGHVMLFSCDECKKPLLCGTVKDHAA